MLKKLTAGEKLNRRDFLEALATGVAATQLPVDGATMQEATINASAVARAGQLSNRLVVPVRVNPLLFHPRELRLKLDGEWQFRLDPRDVGLVEGWHRNPARFVDRVRVPGCWQGQGFGNEGSDKVWDFQFDVRTLRATYKGTGWYAKGFEVPRSWHRKRFSLNFGGVHPSAEVWLNGTKLGENTLPFVPFGFDVTDLVCFDKVNSLVVRVHEQNRVFGLAFNFQGNWSGLYRGVDLTATGDNSLGHFLLRPDLNHQKLEISTRIAGKKTTDVPLFLDVSIASWPRGTGAFNRTFKITDVDAQFEMPIESPAPWSPDSPNLYRVDAVLRRDGITLDAVSERTGFVKLSTKGERLLINGEPYFMRGTGDFALCPETGSPDIDRARWRRKLKTLRGYGYNYVRCQSYLYPSEYFDVADEVGLLVQSEMGILGGWGGVSPYHGYQWPRPTPDNYPILKRQWDLSVLRDVNHPSANIYCMSNESGDGTEFSRIAWSCYTDTKEIKPTALVIWTDGGYNAELPADFINSEAKSDGHHLTPPLDRMAKPLIQHEFRWWSSFPDVRLMSRYNGAIRPYGALIALEAAQNNGQRHLLEKFAQSSNHLQLIEAKGKMEMRRGDHARLAGICHFNAMDCNPSPQGILNEFYERKLVDAVTWRRTNGDTVILCSLGFNERVWGSRETRRCVFRISDFSHPPFQAPVLEWNLVDSERKILDSGVLRWKHEPFQVCAAGEITVSVPSVSRPTAARLIVRMVEGARKVDNEWNVWLFPNGGLEHKGLVIYRKPTLSWLKGLRDIPLITETKHIDAGSSLILAERLDHELVVQMRRGANVLLVGTKTIVRTHPVSHLSSTGYFFTPPANYPPYSDGQNGTIIIPHPFLDGFPNEGFADLDFYRMIQNAPPMDLKAFELNNDEPVIRVIHRYPVCHPLAYLLERRIGSGRLIICALEFSEKWPEACYLLNTILEYCCKGDKSSCPDLGPQQLTLLMAAFA